MKEDITVVPKAWGYEEWLVNCPEYCGKILHLNSGAISSYHYHPVKKETFYALEGQVVLTINDKDYLLNPAARPKTILPGNLHQFRGITGAKMIEISTHHDDADIIRITKSRGQNDNNPSSA